MNKWMKTAAAVLVAGLLCSAKSWAVTYDALCITVTPSVNYSIAISSDDASLALGTLALGQSTFTVCPATVTFGGDIDTGHEAKLTASIAGGWNFNDTTNISTETAGTKDLLNMYALFSSTGLGQAPSGDVFGDNDASGVPDTLAAIADANTDNLIDTAIHIGGQSGPGTQFEYQAGGAGDKDMDMIDLNSGVDNSKEANLWFFLRLPSQTTDNAEKKITVVLTHKQGVDN